MPYDPTLPVNGSPIVSAELRGQFSGLNDLITDLTNQVTTLNTQVAALQTQMSTRAGSVAGVADLNVPFHDPVAQADMGPVTDKVNEILAALQT